MGQVVGWRVAGGLSAAPAFLQVAKPAAVLRAEGAGGGLCEEEVLEAITAYQLAVGQTAQLVRQLLPAYGGCVCALAPHP